MEQRIATAPRNTALISAESKLTSKMDSIPDGERAERSGSMNFSKLLV